MSLNKLATIPLCLALLTSSPTIEGSIAKAFEPPQQQLLLAHDNAINNRNNWLYDRNARGDRQQRDRRNYYRSRYLQARQAEKKLSPREAPEEPQTDDNEN